MPFGERASSYKKRRADADDEVWIKNLRDGETRLRLLDEPDDFVTYREHYEEGVGYYPCSEEKDCVGCNSTSDRVKQRQRRYAFHCIDQQGRLQVYKMGSKLEESMERKAARLANEDPPESVLDRDYIFIRSGKGLGTTYDAEAGKKYELDDVPSTRYDIPLMLEDKYAQAVALYEGKEPPKPRSPVLPSDEDEPETAPLRMDKGKSEEEPPWNQPYDGTEAQESRISVPENGELTVDNVALMQTADLRKLLADAGQELPARTPRSRVVATAQKWVREGQPAA